MRACACACACMCVLLASRKRCGETAAPTAMLLNRIFDHFGAGEIKQSKDFKITQKCSSTPIEARARARACVSSAVCYFVHILCISLSFLQINAKETHEATGY